MASHKEEPNTSSLFGDSSGDDPFSQLQQQQQQPPASEPATKKDEIQDKQPAVSTAQEQQPKAVVGDASSLFGNSGDGNADLFFSSTNATAHATPQSTHPPLETNASAASFFDQPPPAAANNTTASNSFFDDLGQQHAATELTPSYSQESQQQSTNPASNLTQAYDPNTYNNYDYSQQGGQEQQQQQQYDQTQWIQFDPNQHYYYDDQGQVHYYDPNTNQEYDMSQYGYDQQGQTYDYQYDPQYADYYAQQGYDPNAYAATAIATDATPAGEQQAYAPVQDSYDPNTYAPTTATPQPSESATTATAAAAASDPHYYQPNNYAPHQADYSAQSYAPVQTNAVAEVPAQVQSEQTIDTQHYTAEQQQDPYGVQNYPAVDTSAAAATVDTNQQQQQVDYSYSSYDPNAATATVATSEFEQGHYGQDAYAPVDLNNTNYASIQAAFEAEDLQQLQAPPPSSSAAAATRDVASPPLAAGPPKQVISPPPAGPPKNVISPPPPARSTVTSPPPQAHTPPAALSTRRESIDVNEASESTEQHKEAPEEDLNDLDDLVLGGSGSQQQDSVSEKMDRLTVADDAYDNQKTADDTTAKQSQDAHIDSSHEDQKVPETEIKTEPTVFASVLSVDEPEEVKKAETSKTMEEEPQVKDTKETEKPAEASQEASYFPPVQASDDHTQTSPSQHVPEQNEQVIAYEPDQSATYDFNYGYEPTPQSTENAYEPSQAVGFESQPVTGYEPTTGYEPQQASAYEPEQVASYEPTSGYEPTSTYEPTASYEPQQQTTAYEPQQNDAYAPQETNYEPQQASGYEPTSYAPQSTNAYDPANATTGGYEPQQYGGYEPTAPATQFGAPPPAAAAPATTAPERNITSPPPPSGPPRAGSIKSVASPPPGMQSYYPQRANSITEPDRRHHSSSPFAGYYGNNNNNGINPQYPVMERSATVPPPMTERMASPRPQLIPCPDRLCEGENKPKAKFCCECGRPLAGISRSTTPSAMSPSAYNAVGMDGFSPMSNAVFGAVGAEPVQRTALDDKKDEMVASLKQFVDSSVVVQSDLDQDEKRRRALAYIESRLASFDEKKALLWRVVQAMLEHSTCALGDGGELDKAVVALVSSSTQDNSTSSEGHLDQLEAFLSKGDRESACQFANEHDMWGHSLVIASSVNDDLLKKTVTQFIQRELFSTETELVPQVPGDKKALRMLYSVFNGAGADAVSEYVKPSAHAEAVYSDETLQGWQSALTLILANRSTNDQAAIQGLGDQLKHLNKDNEARLCYLLSPDVSGLDNSKMIGDDVYTDLDALYLVELYEFASKATIQQDFKLVLAWWLKDLGFSEESQKYTEAIGANLVNASRLDTLRQIGNISPAAQSSEHVTSLLNKQTFDALIGSIETKVTSIAPSYGDSSNYASANYNFDSQGDYNSTQAHDYTGQETAADSLQHDAYNYGYGYGGGYTESADATVPQTTAAAVTSPFGKPKGIQSPFQQANVQPVSSPFGMQNKAAAPVTSPFGQAAPASNDNNSAWWGASDANQTEEYQPYQPETNANTSYQPDAYTPAAATATTTTTTTPAAASSAWDDDDDLGFGNSKPKKKQEQDTDTKTTDSTVQEKPNEVDDKKEKEHTEKTGGGGWGIFSLFGRKEKDPNPDEKKAVKANLGEQSSFYYDETEKRWVNKLNDTKPAAATPPPPPKSATPQPPASKPMVPPPVAGLKPSSMPPPRINSAPNVPSMSGQGGLPNAVPPPFSTPQAGRRAAGGGRKSVRSRYVDVLSTEQK